MIIGRLSAALAPLLFLAMSQGAGAEDRKDWMLAKSCIGEPSPARDFCRDQIRLVQNFLNGETTCRVTYSEEDAKTVLDRIYIDPEAQESNVITLTFSLLRHSHPCVRPHRNPDPDAPENLLHLL